MRSVDESENLPFGQSGHVAVVVSSCCPSKQLKHPVRLRFDICFRSVHVRQLVMPALGVYKRRGFGRSLHDKQVVEADNGPYLPGAQSVHTKADEAEYLPARHCLHVVMLAAAVTFEYSPAAQAVQYVWLVKY